MTTPKIDHPVFRRCVELLAQHQGIILRKWTYPHPLEVGVTDPVVILGHLASSGLAREVASWRSDGRPVTAPSVVVAASGARVADLLEATKTSEKLAHELRHLRPHTLYVVVFAYDAAMGCYWAWDPAARGLRALQPTVRLLDRFEN